MTNRHHPSGIKPVCGRRILSLALAASVALLPRAEADAQEPTTEQLGTASGDIVRINVVLMVIAEHDQAEIEAEFRERQFPKFAREHGMLEVGPDEDPELTLRLQIIQP